MSVGSLTTAFGWVPEEWMALGSRLSALSSLLSKPTHVKTEATDGDSRLVFVCRAPAR